MGGNESATKYFQSHGGTAALSSKDPKTKYTSNAATKYKDELKKRAAADAREYATNISRAKMRLRNLQLSGRSGCDRCHTLCTCRRYFDSSRSRG